MVSIKFFSNSVGTYSNIVRSIVVKAFFQIQKYHSANVNLLHDQNQKRNSWTVFIGQSVYKNSIANAPYMLAFVIEMYLNLSSEPA